MRVLYLVARLPRESGGVKTVVTTMANELSIRHDVAIAVVPDSPRERQAEDVKVDRTAVGPRVRLVGLPKSRTRSLLLAPFSVLRLPVVRRYGYRIVALPLVAMFAAVVARSLRKRLPFVPDVVHVHGTDVCAHVGRRLAKQLGCRLVCSGHTHPGQYGDGPIDAATYRAADAVIAVSEPEHAVYTDLGVRSDRVHVIHPPSRDAGVRDPALARARLGIDGPLAVFAGARRSYKGSDVAAAAVPLIRRQVPDFVCAFLGPGEKLELQPGIIDVGEVGVDEYLDWIAAADVLLLPSAYEACSIVVLEAWSASVPVIVSDIPTLRFQVEASGGGLAVPRDGASVAAAVCELLADPDRRMSMGRSGRAYWERHARLDRLLEATESVFGTVPAASTLPVASAAS